MPYLRIETPVTPVQSLLSLMLPLSPDSIRTSGSSLALVGPTGCQKTGLLVQAAVSVVTMTEDKVMILAVDPIARRPHSVHHMPLMNQKSAPRILLHYFKSTAELIQFLADYHHTDSYPSAVIIDDLQIFAQRKFLWGQEYDPCTVLSKILSLARQVCDFCTERSKHSCYLLVAGQDTLPLRPVPKHSPDSKSVHPEFSTSLVPVIRTLIENVVHVQRHEQSETTDQMNIHMDFDRYHICLYAMYGQLFIERVEDEHSLVTVCGTDCKPIALPVARTAVTSES